MVEPGFYLGDCMDYLKDMPDKSVDLAICDPPYGINVGKASMGMGGGENRRGKALRKESESGASNYQPQNL